MKLFIGILGIVSLALAAVALAGDGHVKAPLQPVNGSGVSGSVQLEQLPHGGTNVHVLAHGLTRGQAVNSFYYDGANCQSGPDLIGSIKANGGGTGEVHAKIDDDLDEVGSVSVRIPFYSTLLACANVH